MIENCHHEKNIELNFQTIPCCLKHLLIMNHISEEYLITEKFGKYILRIFKNIFDKEKIFIKFNTKANNNFINEFFSMITKYMCYFYFIDKTNLSKYLCKIAFNYYNQGMNNIKTKSKEINIIKNNLCCIYSKENKYDKALNIIKEISNTNNNININSISSNDNLILLNNYINLYIKSKKKIDKEILNKINTLKTCINQKLHQIIQSSKSIENNKSLYTSLKSKNDFSLQEINLYLFIYYNYCTICSKINNANASNNLANYKKGYELCLIYLGENNHLSIKYKIMINKFVLNKTSKKKIAINKNEINSKLNEINNRLDKIGKSILPVKKIISNYKNNRLINSEEKKIFSSAKNSRTEIYSKNIIKKEEEKKNQNDNDENNNEIIDENDKEKKEEKKEETQIKIEMPKIVIKLNEDNNDELVCNTLYQECDTNEKEEEKKKEEIKENLKKEPKEEEKEETQIKIEMPKIVIKLNEENNDELVCNTLYQEYDNNEKEDNKKEEPKEEIKENPKEESKEEKKEEEKEEKKEQQEEIPKIFIPKINVNLDNTNNDDYICETFFIPTDEADAPSKKKENSEKPPNQINLKNNNNINKNFTFSLSTSVVEEPKESSQNIISDTNKLSNQELLNKFFIDLKFYHVPLINIYNQKEDTFDISKYLTELKEKNPTDTVLIKFDYKLRILNNSNLIIKLEVLKNLSIRLFLIDKDNNNEGLLSTQYTFKKILGLYQIIRFDLVLPFTKSYLDFVTYNDYITKTFLNFITINKENNEYKFKMAKKPLGLCHSNIVINLYFSKVVFDIMVVEQNYCKIILSSENDDFNCMILDTFFDEESFNMLINKEVFENDIPVYNLKNNDLNNNELILDLIKNLQKCFNGFCSGIVNVFDDMYPKANSNQKKLKELLVFKLDIKDQLKSMKLTSCLFDSKICKVMTIDQNLLKSKGIIYRHEISDLFGYETSEVWNKLYSYQKLVFSRIILRCAIFKEENSIMALDKYQIVDEINFVYKKKVCNFCLIKIKDFVYVKFMMYESVGTFEFNKVIFLKSDKIKFDELKLINIKEKLVLEVDKSIECINNEDDSLFSFLNID